MKTIVHIFLIRGTYKKGGVGVKKTAQDLFYSISNHVRAHLLQIELNSFLVCVLRRGCKCQTNRQIHKQDCSSNSMHNEQFAEPRIWSTPYKGCSPFLRCVSCHMLEIMLVPFFSFISWHIQRVFNGSSHVSDVPRVY